MVAAPTYVCDTHKTHEQDEGGGDEQGERARRLAAVVLWADAGLRRSLLGAAGHGGGEEEAREGALEGLRRAAGPYQAAVRAYLRSVYEADRALTASLKEAEEQVGGWAGGWVS